MLMIGSNSYMGSFERSDTPQRFLQHCSQEKFLHSFYEDEEFRNQVLRCLMSKTEADSRIPMRLERKPRRTWMKDFECTGLLLTSDDEAEGDSCCSDVESMLTSQRKKYRDAICQCPEHGCPGTHGGPFWNLLSDVPIAEGTVSARNYPEPGCSTNLLRSGPPEAPAPAIFPGEKQWHVASCCKPTSSPPHQCKEGPLNHNGLSSANAAGSGRETVHPVAAWLGNVCVEPRGKPEFSCMPKAPGLLFSSNPLASLDWEDNEHLTKFEPASVRPPTCSVQEEQATSTPLNVDEEHKENDAEHTVEPMLCSWDSLLKRLFKVKVRVGFTQVKLGHSHVKASSKCMSSEPSAHLHRPFGKVFQI